MRATQATSAIDVYNTLRATVPVTINIIVILIELEKK